MNSIYNSQDMEPKCSLIDECIKMSFIYVCVYVCVCLCTIEYYLAIKKEWNNAISHNMDGLRDCQTKWSKSDRERQIYGSTTHLS